ncbi:MAG: chemotaxis protein CheW [Reinekea forsetii]|jgi:chemotaxis signal transduction protein|uniref:Positive regulator of CheA protein activity (CheW) n=1 Tax=Reinekea forsetii TaxID=1336806 RepID=A0A2K8KX89_9GAMM|nr:MULTISPECIES: chemotaxis protein CheW [Reinekea]ATX78231.1 positive regulator of CheA protein activity (CheW) [Reinekea forsetii]MDO7641389.1 chemotaxis protein CheW [Reinekea forsetii]MDO7643701.1 chemotaxis protein CheW [Reinekea forsetii]MDO7673241.1 chemotaxis protein CheW [Reinekea forsetii]
MDTTQMWVVVQLNAQPVAFPATLIKEVVPWQPLNPVPSKALGVMGLINLRGETLAVMDVLTMSGLGCIAQPSFMLVLDFPDSRVGLAVDRIEGVQYFTEEQIDIDMAGGYIQGTTSRDDRLYQLISPSALEQLMARFTDVSAIIESS